ncbi:MAG TPA: preprotein translocase subunit SecE [Candidatus Paceibacterota bacterium]
MGLIQYVRDTQGELRHVAWPTRLQTIVYTVLVATISIAVALYLGFFDYIFTSSLSRFVGAGASETPALQITPQGDTSGLIIDAQPVQPSLDEQLPAAE